MAIFLTIGAATSDPCTVRVTGRSVKPIEYNTFIVAYEQDLSFEGYLYANGPAALSVKMLALERALAIPNVSIGLSYTGGQTHHWLSTAGAIGNVRLKAFAYSDTPLHMAKECKYNLTVTGMYNAVNELRSVVQLDETLSYTGTGGPNVVLAPQAGALSVYQQIADYTDVTVVQTGKMTSRTLVNLPSPVITTEGAFQHKQAKDTISYVMKGTQIWLFVRDYSYTFILPELPAATLPTYLT